MNTPAQCGAIKLPKTDIYSEAPHPPATTSLNEGGGFHPRNPSTTQWWRDCWPTLNEGGGFHPRNPLLVKDGAGWAFGRSMKAGAFTPATPATYRPDTSRTSSLNEGGGFHPRNPSQST